MTIGDSGSACEADMQEISQILEEIELASQTGENQWTDKRVAPRRRARLECKVRFLSPDGEIVLDTSGWTRDISRTGLGFVTREHFARKAQLSARVQVSNSPPRTLTGTVVYSRIVNDGWYLTGMKFESVSDKRLMIFEKVVSSSSTIIPVKKPRKSAETMKQEIQKSKGDRHSQLLRMLKSVASSGTRSRDKINEVLLCTSSSNYEIRRASVHACMQLPREEAITALITMLEDVKDTIRAEAAEALGCLGGSFATQPLKKLLKSSNPEVSLRAAGALGRIGDQSGLSIIANILQTDNAHTRLAAMCFGAAVGHNFRPNSQGIEEARRYLVAKHK